MHYKFNNCVKSLLIIIKIVFFIDKNVRKIEKKTQNFAKNSQPILEKMVNNKGIWL